ncbi:MAG: cation transporter [Candidatus Eisenbacteria bacterium]|uniref:Cation transporter n=1 Tax=Eiseniibacteriota bacterium TaxID=2212470 RepID=A0A9D6QPF9_UNCEI|nr:cation transporter [Candidatus Eisenbacteria bacterium]MBI3539904.1 cation transporter [Candidatus Eisenbacteria bacterium]
MDGAVRLRRIIRILWAILGLNLLVALAKLLYGQRSGAIAMSADGVHSLIDGASNVVALIGLAVSRRPPDANHPYGHRKYETFAALGIVAMMFLGCREILGEALERLHHPRMPDVSPLGYAVIGVTVAINVAVVLVERREGRRLQSEILISDAAHTGSDVLASVLVLMSFAVAPFGWAWADVLVAALIVVLIAIAGARIVRGTLSTLSDERRIDPEPIERVALEEPGVLEAHNVRSRGPDDDIHLDLHILVAPHMAIAAAHALGHRVERRLRERWPGVTDVVVHVEPALESERATAREGGGLRAEG